MIPYEQLCAALDRYNNVPSAQAEEVVLAVATGDLEVIEEAAVVEEAPAMMDEDVSAAVDGAFPFGETPGPVDLPHGEAIVSSGGEDAAAATGFIGSDVTPVPVVPNESAIQVEPALEDHRLDHTDEVSLDDVEMVGNSDPEDPNVQG